MAVRSLYPLIKVEDKIKSLEKASKLNTLREKAFMEKAKNQTYEVPIEDQTLPTDINDQKEYALKNIKGIVRNADIYKALELVSEDENVLRSFNQYFSIFERNVPSGKPKLFIAPFQYLLEEFISNVGNIEEKMEAVKTEKEAKRADALLREEEKRARKQRRDMAEEARADLEREEEARRVEEEDAIARRAGRPVISEADVMDKGIDYINGDMYREDFLEYIKEHIKQNYGDKTAVFKAGKANELFKKVTTVPKYDYSTEYALAESIYAYLKKRYAGTQTQDPRSNEEIKDMARKIFQREVKVLREQMKKESDYKSSQRPPDAWPDISKDIPPESPYGGMNDYNMSVIEDSRDIIRKWASEMMNTDYTNQPAEKMDGDLGRLKTFIKEYVQFAFNEESDSKKAEIANYMLSKWISAIASPKEYGNSSSARSSARSSAPAVSEALSEFAKLSRMRMDDEKLLMKEFYDTIRESNDYVFDMKESQGYRSGSMSNEEISEYRVSAPTMAGNDKLKSVKNISPKRMILYILKQKYGLSGVGYKELEAQAKQNGLIGSGVYSKRRPMVRGVSPRAQVGRGVAADPVTKPKVLNRFNVLRGELVAGNNHPELIKELRTLLLRMVNDGMITKHDFNLLTSEIFLLI